MKQFVFGALTMFLIVAFGGGAYYLGQRQSTGNVAQPTPSPVSQLGTNLLAATPTPIPNFPVSSPSPAANLLPTIQSAVSGKAYTTLESNMATNVHVIKQATSCCGTIAKSQAVIEMAYLNSATAPWNFDQNSLDIKQIKAKGAENYGTDTLMGVSSDDYVVAFTVGADGKIATVAMSVSKDLIGQ